MKFRQDGKIGNVRCS